MFVFSSRSISLLPLFDVTPSPGNKCHFYSQGSKIYNPSSDFSFEHKTHISNWLFTISTWMFQRHLKLNISKTNSDLSKPFLLILFTSVKLSPYIVTQKSISLINNIQSITKAFGSTFKIHLQYPKCTLNFKPGFPRLLSQHLNWSICY